MPRKDYIRVGTHYYKYIIYPLSSGDETEKLVLWNIETIVRDHGKSFVGQIPKYDGFCLMPEHVEYKESYKNHLNKYEPIPCKPVAGDYSKIIAFLKHIFQEQIEIGLDYLAILYLKPIEKLPVFCLVSKERGTGKTTFLNLLKLIFGGNFTYNTNEDFRSQFNSHWSSKLIVAVDEVLLDKKEDSERIKNLSTAKTYKSEAKGVDKQEVEIICKFILCSNNVDSFIHVELGETRYWVRKILPFETENENLLQEMKMQIPAFLHFLKERGIITPKTSRMWFDFKLYETHALKRLIKVNRNRLEMQIANTLIEIMDCFELEEYCFCIKDLQNNLNKTNKSNFDHSSIIRILKDEWKLVPNKITSTYTTYLYASDGFLVMNTNNKGRFYCIKRVWMKENFDDLMT
ncbi:primase-helicase family protein [Arachidicoccus sp.]|uniref:primase-helicase family protein n=1 Tax=Arachidicoccus sp. TaxID=1872624 RepID=UPI003D1ECF42